MKSVKNVLAITIVGVLAACAVPAEPDLSPAAEDGQLGDEQTITYNGYVASAAKPTRVLPLYANAVRGSATFTGPSTPMKMGVCVLQLTTTACSGNDAIDPSTGYQGPCTTYPIGSGGFRYCAAPDNSGQKYCAIRAGSQAAQCAGSPALPCKTASGATCTCGSSNCFPQAVAPGTYTTPNTSLPTNGTSQWISYACFNACKGDGNSPSISSVAYANTTCIINHPAECPEADYCSDMGCDGTINGGCYKNGKPYSGCI